MNGWNGRNVCILVPDFQHGVTRRMDRYRQRFTVFAKVVVRAVEMQTFVPNSRYLFVAV